MINEAQGMIGNPRKRVVRDGFVVLENARGQVVRTFFVEDQSQIIAIYRHDNRRIEVHSSVEPLLEEGVSFDTLAATDGESLKSNPVPIGLGVLRFSDDIRKFPPNYELLPEDEMKAPVAFGWSAGVQVAMGLLFVLAGLFSGSGVKKESDVAVTILPQAVVDQMIDQVKNAPPESKYETAPMVAQAKRARNVVVAPSESKIKKNAPVPTRSTGKVVSNKRLRGGGYKGSGPRGYGTNEPYMNSIGALGALNNAPRVKGGNGGSGGLNLQAVGTEPGSGAGGKGYGGFGNNGSGGRGKGGLGRGTGQGLANAMYGKGLIAAPFGDGGGAPGSGGYGTRGRMGGGAQGAGYGRETVVGSWKGTGPKGNGPAGSGSGNGDPDGSPWGAADGDDDGSTVITGGLDRDQIEQVIRRNIGQITYCYEQGLQREPNLSGRVTVRFQIAGSGRVSTAAVKDSSVRSAQVEGCIVSKLRNWTFPKPHGGVNVAVTYPFALRRTVTMR